MNSYSQYGEDTRIAAVCAAICPSNRTYVDVGAHHWRDLSNTLAFYELGWSGVLVEPIENYHRGYREHRPRDVALRAACGPTAHEVAPFFVNDAMPEMSTTLRGETHRLAALRGYAYREVRVPVVTLDAVARDYGSEPGFCSLDVEGAEERVLAGRGSFRPCLFVIESLEHASYADLTARWAHHLPDYVQHDRTELNTLWVRRDLVGRIQRRAAAKKGPAARRRDADAPHNPASVVSQNKRSVFNPSRDRQGAVAEADAQFSAQPLPHGRGSVWALNSEALR